MLSSLQSWAVLHPGRVTVMIVLVAVWLWTGQTYVWNPFWTFGYQYYGIFMFSSAGGLGFLLPKRKRPEKQSPRLQQPSNSVFDRSQEMPVVEPIESNTFPPPPLESLRDDDE